MFNEMKQKMEKALALVQEELAMIRTGRAKPSLIENVEVEAYPGTRMKLLELASISAPDTHLLTVSPWDQSTLKKIEAGIMASGMGLNPVVDGNIIRIAIPPLTEERRRDLVKLVKQKIESGKQLLRDIRTDAKKDVEDQKDDAGVSEDDIHAWLEELQGVYDTYVVKLQEMGERKEQELMEI